MNIVYKEDGQRRLLESCMVGVVDHRHALNILRGSQELEDRAVKWTKGQIRMSSICNNDERRLSAQEISMLNCHNDSFSALFHCHCRFVNMGHSILIYAINFLLNYKIKPSLDSNQEHCKGRGCVPVHPKC